MSAAANPAVLGRARSGAREAGVAARDFARPRRLAPEHAQALATKLAAVLPALESELARTTGLALDLALDGIGEADAAALLAGLAEPLTVLRFRCAKSPAWLVWDPRAAAVTVEALLGARGATAEARTLTHVEARVATTFLTELVRGVAAPLGLATSDVALVQLASELGSWRDGGADAEPYRLEVRLALAHGGAERGVLRLYLPPAALGALGDAPKAAPLPRTLPAHLEHVEVELAAQLPGCELFLDQLLALEAGDVIPLAAREGDPTSLVVDGLTLARARLGSHHGRLAVRVERMDVHGEPEASGA